MARFVILGCGHSGSTLLSGLIHQAGYRSVGIPTTTYECFSLNRINEIILDMDNPLLRNAIIDKFWKNLEAANPEHWVLKDPLFPFTYPVFHARCKVPIRLLFIYRNPANNVEHLVRKFSMWMDFTTEDQTKTICEHEWLQKNYLTLDFIRKHPDLPCLWVDYDELLSGNLYKTLCAYTGECLNPNFIQPRKKRAQTIVVSPKLTAFYEELQVEAQIQNERMLATHTLPFRKHSPIVHKISYYFQRSLFWSGIMILKRLLGQANYIRPPFPNFGQYLQDQGISSQEDINNTSILPKD